MKKIMGKYLDYRFSEKRKVEKILNDLITKNDEFASSLIETYDLYCKGYNFFDNLAFGYGLTLANDFYDYTEWIELSPEGKKNRVEAIYEGVREEAEKVKYWIGQGSIIFTAETDEYGHFFYIDNRTTAEKQPSAYKRQYPNEVPGNAASDLFSKKDRNWWQKLLGLK